MNDLDYKFWWTFGLSAYSVLLGIVVWLRRPGEEAGAAVNKLREDVRVEIRTLVDRMSGEVADLRNVQGILEERMSSMPSRDELTTVAGDLKAIRAEVGGLVNTQSSHGMALGRIESYLLNRGTK